jgi:chromosome partitioning protein
MTKSLVLASAKGGVGKTTTALNLGVALAERGLSTLLVDLDPQGAIGLSLAKNESEWLGLADLVSGEAVFDTAVLQTKLPGLALLPRGQVNPMAFREFERDIETSNVISDQILEQASGRFEYVLFDTPSGLSTVSIAALSAADFALLPMQAEPLALRSLGQALEVIAGIKEDSNPQLELLGILPTMVRTDQQASLNVMTTIWSELGGVLETHIPRAEVFALASEEGLPVSFLSGPQRIEGGRFEMLATELVELIARLTGDSGVDDERPRREPV